MHQGELAPDGGRGEAPAKPRKRAPDIATAPPLDHGETRAEDAVTPLPPKPPKPEWRAAWDPAIREWNALVESTRQSGTLTFYANGYAELIPRLRALAENPDIPSEKRAPLVRTLQNHERHLAARKKIVDFLAAAERHMQKRGSLRDAATGAGAAIAEVTNCGPWRREAERLREEGEAILSDRRTCGPHLDNVSIRGKRARGAVSDLGQAIREDDEELALAESKAHEQRLLASASARLMFSADPGVDAADADQARHAPLRGMLSRLGHAVGRLAGGEAYEERMRAQAYRRKTLERTGQAMRDWNRLVARAVEEGVHVIRMGGYDRLHEKLDVAVSGNFHMDARSAEEIDAVLAELDKARTNARYVETLHRLAMRSLERREALEAEAARRGVAVPNLADYGRWRTLTDRAVDRGAYIQTRGDYFIHLHGVESGGERLASALARAHKILYEDNRHIAATRKPEREDEDVQACKEGIAHILDDPEKLRELRIRSAERRREEERRSEGRHQSRGISM